MVLMSAQILLIAPIAGTAFAQTSAVSIQYLRVFDHDKIKDIQPECNKYEEEHLGMKVSDNCCDLSKWPEGTASQTPPDARTKPGGDTKKWNCYAQERVAKPGTYTRNFLGCEGGTVKASEGCAPAGTGMGNGYPMNETLAMESFVDGDSASCGCEQPGYVGEGCFVAMTSYIKRIGNDTFANFVKLTGADFCSSGSEDDSTQQDSGSEDESTDDVSIQYLRVWNHSLIKDIHPACNKYEREHLGMKVSDDCCDLSKWPEGAASQTPPDARTKPGGDPKKWNCYVQERVAVRGSYTRNFLGCEGGTVKASEGCAPAGTGMGNGYPMNETLAMASFVDGDSASCGCEQPGYVGEGCFVAMTSYIKGVGNDVFANFVKLSGAGACKATSDDKDSSKKSSSSAPEGSSAVLSMQCLLVALYILQ